MSGSVDIMPDLEIRHLVKRFGSVTAVDDFSIDVPPGEILALLGPSGSGKSTLLAMIGGQLHPDAGEILLAGRSIEKLPPNRIDTATVFQDYALFPHLTVAENIGFGLRMRRLLAQEITEKTAAILRLVELEGYEHRYPAQLSGGQRQRAATARALVLRPRVLLMDEPLSALDLQIRLRLQRELRDLLRRVDVTTIIVTHDQQEAFVLADRIAVMHDGRLEQVGRPVDLYRAPATRFVATFLGDGTLLPGTVLSAQAGELVVDCAGSTLRARGAGASGDAVTVLVRPEEVTLVADAEAPDASWRDAVVKRVFNTGELTRYALCIGAQQLAAVELGRPRFAAGDKVAICVNSDNVVAIHDTA